MDSKNLKKLTIELGTMGCIMYVVDPKFSKLKDKKFPPLEDLSLEAFPLSTANVDYWMTAMDWSQLRSLELRETRDPTYFLDKTLDSAGGLPGLETVRIELPLFYHSDTGADEEAFRNTFLRFLSEPRTKGLSTVGIEGEYRPYLPTILEEQGATLRSLRLHSSERYRDPQREMLSVQELRGIGLQAPNLEEITVDINKLNGSLVSLHIPTISLLTLNLIFATAGRIYRYAPLRDFFPIPEECRALRGIGGLGLHLHLAMGRQRSRSDGPNTSCFETRFWYRA